MFPTQAPNPRILLRSFGRIRHTAALLGHSLSLHSLQAYLLSPELLGVLLPQAARAARSRRGGLAGRLRTPAAGAHAGMRSFHRHPLERAARTARHAAERPRPAASRGPPDRDGGPRSLRNFRVQSGFPIRDRNPRGPGFVVLLWHRSRAAPAHREEVRSPD